MTLSRPDLKHFREVVLGLSQAQFGAALGETGLCRPASASAVSKWERADIGVTRRRRAAMSDRFSLTLEEVDEILKVRDDSASGCNTSNALFEVRTDCLPWLGDRQNGSAGENFIGLTGASGRTALAR